MKTKTTYLIAHTAFSSFFDEIIIFLRFLILKKQTAHPFRDHPVGYRSEDGVCSHLFKTRNLQFFSSHETPERVPDRCLFIKERAHAEPFRIDYDLA